MQDFMNLDHRTRDTRLSIREMEKPGTIAAVTGYMEVCDECGSPYRRMSTEGRAICGRCYPIVPVVSSQKSA